MLAYHHLVRGEAVQLPEAPVYENYIHGCSGATRPTATPYWRQYLAGVKDRRRWSLQSAG